MSLETLLVSVGILGALQGTYLVLKNMGNSSSASYSDTLEDRAARKMKTDFEIARAKAIMAMASEFSGAKA